MPTDRSFVQRQWLMPIGRLRQKDECKLKPAWIIVWNLVSMPLFQKQGVEMHPCDSSTLEEEAGQLDIQSHPGLLEILNKTIFFSFGWEWGILNCIHCRYIHLSYSKVFESFWVFQAGFLCVYLASNSKEILLPLGLKALYYHCLAGKYLYHTCILVEF